MDQSVRLQNARQRMHQVFSDNQLIGRTLTTGCTAVEITQRCNLDCTLCYLSENSESVSDIPLEEVFRRLREIRRLYGPRTSVQITGGDPTLRKHDELIEIVRYAREIGLFPALFTNGIAASRKLLTQLAKVGLCDVAFHVDTTQRRDGYDTEHDLNQVRDEYLARAEGLGLMVIFNTTVHQGNIHEIGELVSYFVARAHQVGFASFQLQAETGRGEWGERDDIVSLESIRRRISTAVAAQLPWDVFRIGHPRCHSYVPTLVINQRVYPLLEDAALLHQFAEAFHGQHADRRLGKLNVLVTYLLRLLRQPRWLWRGFRFAAALAWRARRDLLAAHGRVTSVSFFVQNFMDAKALDAERIEACSFYVMTADGPVSMCEHNANRDEYILKPLLFRRADGTLGKYEPLVSDGRSQAKELVMAETA